MTTLAIKNNNKLFSVDKEAKTASLYFGEECIWSQPLAELFFASAKRPWEIDYAFTIDEITEAAETVTVSFFCKALSGVAQFSFGEPDALRLNVSVKNKISSPLECFTFGATFKTNAPTTQKVVIPHVIYNDNPGADPYRTVAHIGKTEGLGIIVEEHRLPIPAVNIEWEQGGGFRYITVLSVPHVVTGADHDYWSLGALYGGEGKAHTITSTSGPLMFNGMRDIVYGGQGMPLPLERGYRTLQPGQVLEKTFIIDVGETKEGRGFRKLVDLGYGILKPDNKPDHPFRDMIEYKKSVVDSRYRKESYCSGYSCFGTANDFGDFSGRPDYFLYAWTGQALKIAWGEIKLGLDYGETERYNRGVEAVDFFVRETEGQTPGLLRCYYLVDTKEWGGSWDNPGTNLASRMQGEALMDLVDILSLLRDHGKEVPKSWEELVRRACKFLTDPASLTADGIFPLTWNHNGTPAEQFINTAGVPCVDALAKAAMYFDSEEYLSAAKLIFSRYYEYHMRTFDRHFARATFDAKCEDKEAGIYVFCAAADLYKATGDEFYKEAADDAADWLLTFVFFWEIGFLPGSQCAEKKFCSLGWPGVSVQNHHLDVFFPTFEMYEYGKMTSNEKIMHMTLCVANALTYGVCTYPGEWGFTVIGEQGEQYYHTNYFQGWYPDLLNNMHFWRGKMRTWNPSWITAQVLQSSLKFFDGDKA
ncbi:MAG: hypothetical protein E7627_06200 [Ruminococcaceae bacterium]|nr:hypothetical protein [Oscillospiraceae bacterium]